MPAQLRRRLLTLLPRLGLTTSPLGPDANVVAERGDRWRVDALDDRTWLVQRGPGPHRTARRMGPPQLRTHLVVDEAAARTGLPNQQMKLAHYISAEHIAWVLRELAVNCVLDVGGNRGQFGLRLRDAGYDGRIVSFEPLPHLAEQLHQHADKDPAWHVVHHALGDEETEAEMTVVAAGGATSSLLPVSEFGRKWSPRLEGIRKESVPVRRLENVFDDAIAGIEEPRVFLKMDTQGYDLRVFQGAGERIQDVLGLQSEISCVPLYDGMPRMPEAVTAYESAGFETTGIFPVTRDNEHLRAIELDIVMIRTGALPGR
jgi:FkbM family methyltransferase